MALPGYDPIASRRNRSASSVDYSYLSPRSQQPQPQKKKKINYLDIAKRLGIGTLAVGKEAAKAVRDTGATSVDILDFLGGTRQARGQVASTREFISQLKKKRSLSEAARNAELKRLQTLGGKTLFERVSGEDIGTKQGARKFVASAVEAPTYFYGGAAIKGLSKATPAKSVIGKNVLVGLKSGAAEGAITGVTQTLKGEGYKKPSEYLKNVAIGGVAGGALGGVAGGITGKIQANKFKQQSLMDDFVKLQKQASAAKAKDTRAYNKILEQQKQIKKQINTTISERKALEAQYKSGSVDGKPLTKGETKKIVLGIEQNKQLEPKLRQKLVEYGKQLEEVDVKRQTQLPSAPLPEANIATKATNKAAKVLQSGAEKLKASGSQAAREFGGRMDDYLMRKQQGVNQFAELVGNVSKMKPKQFDADVVNPILKGQKLAPDSLAFRVKQVLEDYANVKFPQKGVAVGKLENYFPKMIDTSKKKQLMEWVQSQIDTGKIKPIEGDSAESIFKMLTREVRPKKGSFEYGRTTLEIPEKFYLKDNRAILANYIDMAEDRLAMADVFGPKLEGYSQLLDRALAEGGEETQNVMRNIMETSLYGVKKPSDFARTLGGFQAGTKLGGAVWKNTNQWVNDATTLGTPKYVGKAQLKMLAKPKEAEKLALEAGVNVNEFHDFLLDVVRKGNKSDPMVTMAQKVLDWSQFNRIERWNRIRSANAGASWFDDVVKQAKQGKISGPNLRRLEELRINPAELMKKGSALKEVRNKAIYGHVGRSQFRINPMTMPEWTQSSQLGKAMAQMRSFSYQQQKMLNKAVLKEAVNGNLGPLATYAGLGVPAGAVMTWAKFVGMTHILNAALPKDWEIEPRKRMYEFRDINDVESFARWADESLEFAGGYGLGVDIIKSAKYSDSVPEFVAKTVGGVSVSDAWDWAEMLGNYMTGAQEGDVTKQNKALQKKLVGMIPFFGFYVKQKISPFNPNTVKYYEEKDKLLKGLSKNDKEQYEALKIEYGERGITYPEQRAATYISTDGRLFEVDREAAKLGAKYFNGQYDPLYDLTWQQAQQYFAHVLKGGDMNSRELYSYPWYAQFKEKRNKYFADLNKKGVFDGETNERNKYFVETPASVQAKMDQGIWDDEVRAYQAQKDQTQNALRERIGLVTPDVENLIQSNISSGKSDFKNMTGKSLIYMQVLREAGIPGAFDSFFDKNPELDPTSDQFQGFKGLSGGGYGGYGSSKKGKTRKPKKTQIKMPKTSTVKPYKPSKSKIIKLGTKIKNPNTKNVRQWTK